jgi:hypothetical protein
MLKRISLVLLFLLWTQLSLRCYAGGDDPIGSKSIKQSKSLGVFVSEIPVTPSSFQWNGRSVAVREAWLEQALVRQLDRKHRNEKLCFLCFTLDIDGKPEAGRADDKLRLVFIGPDSRKCEQFIVPVGFRSLLCNFYRSSNMPGRIQHLVTLPRDQILPKVDLRAATYHRDLTENKKMPTEIVLSFDLSCRESRR